MATAAPRSLWQRAAGWCRRNLPTRESMECSRMLRPVAHRVLAPELWRFTRRSVPRAVFAGLFIGIFLMIPGLQIVGAAMLAIPMRANIPIATAMTFLSNPATTPFFLIASLDVGSRLGFHADLASFEALRLRHASLGDWVAWLWTDAAPAMVSGLFVIGLGVALAGYIVSLVGWRWWIGRKWRQRSQNIG